MCIEETMRVDGMLEEPLVAEVKKLLGTLAALGRVWVDIEGKKQPVDEVVLYRDVDGKAKAFVFVIKEQG